MLADVAIDLAGGCLERVRVPTLDDVDRLVRQTVCTRQDGSETDLNRLRDLVCLRTDRLSREVRRLGVRVVDEGGMESSKGVADERDRRDSVEDGELGSLRLRGNGLDSSGHCWATGDGGGAKARRVATVNDLRDKGKWAMDNCLMHVINRRWQGPAFPEGPSGCSLQRI